MDADQVLAPVTRLLRDHAAEWEAADAACWPAQTWAALSDIGVPLAMLDEAHGGFGLHTVDALAIVRAAGAAALPLPIAEAMWANALLARCGIPHPDGVVTVALDGTPVPWARHADWILRLADNGDAINVTLAARTALHIREGRNLAGEPRDSIESSAPDAAQLSGTIPTLSLLQCRACGAALRCQAIAGAIESVLDMTVRYARERTQFGRPIGSFQVIQHQLAVMAGHSVAAHTAADMAAQAFDTDDLLPIAIAKSRCGEAAGAVAGIAHQIHGAIGFAAEHALHRYSKRLWAWREEFGNETYWNEQLGRAAFAAGADDLWPWLTRIE
jgi:acyl-CoA dehydrogenase